MCLIIIYTEVCLEKQLSSTFLIVFPVGYASTAVQENHKKMDTIEAKNYCMLIKISEEHWNRVIEAHKLVTAKAILCECYGHYIQNGLSVRITIQSFIYHVSQAMGPIIFSCTYSTPHTLTLTSCNDTLRINARKLLFWEFRYPLHVTAEEMSMVSMTACSWLQTCNMLSCDSTSIRG